MLPSKKTTKTYGVVLSPSISTTLESKAVSPDNPCRTMLLIQNTGLGDLLVRFGSPILNDGTDIIFPGNAAAGLLWDKPESCPEATIYISSVNGTSVSITEQITR
jgi:hypothetical protein